MADRGAAPTGGAVNRELGAERISGDASSGDSQAATSTEGTSQLVIHIGLQKTGTTFLQSSLDANRAALAACGLVYPSPSTGLDAEGGTAHHFLAHALARRRLAHTPAADFDRLEAHVAALRAACVGAGAGGTAVISSEDLSLLNHGQIRRLRAFFPGDGVRIVVYLRRQDLWLEALYGQMLKVGRHQKVEPFLARRRRRMDYAGLLAPWAKVFGDANLIVRVYEGFETGGLWADFCTAVGVPQAATLVSERTQVNVSLSREASTFLTLIRDDRWRYRLRLALERGQSRWPRSGLSYLSPRQARQIMTDHRAGNDRIAAQYLGRAQLFRDEEPVPVRNRQSRPVRRVLVFWQLLAGLALGLLDRVRGG